VDTHSALRRTFTCAAVAALLVLAGGTASAGAVTVTLGPTTFPGADNGFLCSGGGCSAFTYTQTALGVPGVLKAPTDGTIIGWRAMGSTSGTGALHLRVVHDAGPGFVVTGTSAPAAAVNGTVNSTNLPIAAGDSIGVDLRSGTGSASLSGKNDAGSALRYFIGGLPDNGAPQAGATSSGITMFVNTDVVLAVPAIGAMSPASGPASGGTVVTITGQHLLGAKAVTFGSTPGTITSVTNTQMVAVAPPGAGGTVTVTVTAPGGASAPAQFTYVAPPAVVPDITPPVIRELILSPKRFVAANTGPAIAARVGTRAVVRVSEASTLTFKVARVLSGVKKGKSCVRRTKKRRGRSCKRYVAVTGSFTKAVQPGTNLFTIQGRVAGRSLRPGSYRLSVSAKDAAGNLSKPRTATFQIVSK
jgi:IPT/TIG domain-containing protein